MMENAQRSRKSSAAAAVVGALAVAVGMTLAAPAATAAPGKVSGPFPTLGKCETHKKNDRTRSKSACYKGRDNRWYYKSAGR